MKPSRSMTFVCTCVAALVGATNTTWGQDTTPRARAQAMYDEALRKLDNNQYAEACGMLQEVLLILPELVGVKLTLAECYVRTGKLASASKLYATVESDAERSGQEARRKVAIAKRHALEPRMARMRVIVPKALHDIKDLTVTRDGETIPRDQWGIAVPADRGAHIIEARIPWEPPWKKVVDVWQDGTTLDVTVDMPVPHRPPPLPSSPSIRSSRFWNTERILGVTSGGLGVVGLAMGVGFGAAAIAKKNESDDGHCNAQNQCDPTGLALRQETMTRGNVSTAMFITGSVLVGTGAVLFFLVPGKRGESTTKVGIGPSGVFVTGRF